MQSRLVCWAVFLSVLPTQGAIAVEFNAVDISTNIFPFMIVDGQFYHSHGFENVVIYRQRSSRRGPLSRFYLGSRTGHICEFLHNIQDPHCAKVSIWARTD